MHIAEKIYTERKRLGWSQEQLAEQMEVSRQAVSKWESGQSMPDLDKLVLMSKIFGVSTDYLLKEENHSTVSSLSSEDPAFKHEELPIQNPDGHSETFSQEQKPIRMLTSQEIQDYQKICFQTARKIALGVSLCILGVILYLFVEQFISSNNIMEGEATIVLLCCIAPAVALFVSTGMKMEPYLYLKKEPFQMTETNLKQLREESDRYSHIFMVRITSGVVLCIIAVIILNVCQVIEKRRQIFEHLKSFPVILFLCIITIAVSLFVSSGIRKECYDVLLQKSDYTLSKKKNKKGTLIEVIAGIYWCIVTAGFLGYSLITSDWGRSWIVWPVAGCLFGAISTALVLIQQKHNE